MGTYKLLIDKGPISLPMFALLLLGVSAEHVEDRFAGVVFVWLGKYLSVFVWPAYIMHLAGQAAMNKISESLGLDTTPMIIALVVIFQGAWILFCHYCIDQPAKKYIEARRAAASNTTPIAGVASHDQHNFRNNGFGMFNSTQNRSPEPVDEDWVRGGQARGMSLMGSVL